MKELLNPNILELMPYKAGKPVEEIRRKYNLERVVKLASNENPLPLPEHVTEAITREVVNGTQYPCSDSFYLKNQLAERNGVDVRNLVVGSGSVELIRMIARTFLKPGETVLTSEKTFIMYKIATTEVAGRNAYIEVPMGGDYRFDMDALYRKVDEKTRIIFITNPNNPTGTMVPGSEIAEFIEKVPEDKIIVLDNAYQEYLPDGTDYLDGIQYALNRENVIVLRTFSKIYGLASLRIGYGMSNERLIAYLSRVKAPFNVTRFSQAAASASLRDDEFMNRCARLTTTNREKLFRQLTELGLNPVPSVTNFILFFPGVHLIELNNRLMERGVIVRPLPAFGIPDGMRVSVGVEEDNDFFIETLARVMAEMKS